MWHHLAGTYDGSFVRLYIDGALAASTIQSGAISAMLPSNFLSIGSELGRSGESNCPTCANTRYYGGLIDEVTVYNRGLSGSEIAAIYNAGSAGKCVPAPVVNSFTSSPSTVTSGKSSQLSWDVSSYATNVSIDHGVGSSLPVNGNTTVNPTQTTTYTINATNAAGSATRSVTVFVGGFSLNPGQLNIFSGASSTVTINLDSSQPTPTTVNLSSSNSAIASVPASATVPAGATSTTFSVSAGSTPGMTQVTATLPPALGGTSALVDVSVTAVGLHLNPPSLAIKPGSTSAIDATITPAQPNATTISLVSSNPAVAAPASATFVIPAGISSGSFNVNAKGFGSARITAMIQPSLGGAKEDVDVTVTPVTLRLLPNPATIEGSGTLTASIDPAQGTDTIIALSSSDPSIAAVSATVTIPAGEVSRDFAVRGTGSGKVFITAVLPTELGGGSSVSTLFITVKRVASVVATSFPSPLLVASDNSSVATSTFTLENVGGTDTTVTLGKGGDQGGGFFLVSPTTFPLAAGGSQVVTLTSVGQPLPIALTGFVEVSGAGVEAGTQVAVQLLASALVGQGIPDIVAVTTRVDVAAPIGTDPTGTITYRNDGTTDAAGILSSDADWLIPQPGIVRIDRGATVTVNFRIDRTKQPDAANPAGSLSANIRLVYPFGSTGTSRVPLDGPSLAGAVTTPVTDTRQATTKSDAIPPLANGEVALMIPGVGHVTGSGGKEFISDISILNTQSTIAVPDAKLYFSSSSATVSAPQPVSASQAVQLSDVVNTYFKQGTAVQGTMHIRSRDTSRLAVSANVFNKANLKGTYGTAIPVFRSNRVIGSGEKLVLTGLRKDATAHTNLYLQEMSGAAGEAHIEFFNATGQSLSARDATVSPFSFTAVGAVVPDGGVMAVVTNTSGGKLQAYATPVDDASGDTWAVADWDRQYGLTGTEAMLIPVAGFAPGANGATFRTDIAVTNIGSASGTISLTYYLQNGMNVTKTMTLNANQTNAVADVTESLFLVTGVSVGAIIATPQNGGRFAVTSRTYTASAGDPATYGTGVPTLPVSGALRSGQSQIFGGIEDTTLKTQNAKAGNTFRTNVGLVETSGQPATVKLSIFFADGLNLSAGNPNGTLMLTLAGHEFKQLNGIVRQVLGADRDTRYGDLHNVQVKVEVLSGSTGSVVPFITLTDNGTNDTVLRTE